MAHGHSHGTGDLDVVVSDRVGRCMWAAVAVCFVVVVVGLIVLWPGRSSSGDDPLGLNGDPVGASVTSATVEPCSYDLLLGCRLIELVPRSGDFDGELLVFEQPLASPIRDGDTILVDISPNSAHRR